MERIQVRALVTAYRAVCQCCGKAYKARRVNSRYCDEACQYRAWAAVHRAPGMPRQPKPKARRKA